jgi:hypothetical protein
MVELKHSSQPFPSNTTLPRQHRNGGGDKTDIIGGITGTVSVLVVDSLVRSPAPHRSFRFPLWTALSSQHSFLNAILDP